jgi:hypothetical protein
MVAQEKDLKREAFSCACTAAGWLYDLLGRYNAAFCVCVGVFLCASVGIALTPHPELPVREGK